MELSKIIQDIKENYRLQNESLQNESLQNESLQNESLQNESLQNESLQNESIKHAIYIGVGTAAGYREPDGSLAPKNYHQFPPFLQSLKNSLHDLHLSIILIDPYQEDPPYVVKDKGLSVKDKELDNKGLSVKDKELDNKGLSVKDKELDNKGLSVKDRELDNNKELDNNNTFLSSNKSLTVYTWRENVYTEPYRNVQGIDITSHLRDLNKFAIDSGSLLIYHNFTGKDNRYLAEFFDEELKDHLDHIIYGLGLREDFGCYFDLTDLCSYHPFYIDTNNHIKLFNIYYYIMNEKLYLLRNDINSKFKFKFNDSIFTSHMERILNIVKHELNNVTLQVLRTVFLLIIGEEAQQIDTNLIFFDYEKRNKCVDLITNKSYSELYDFLLTEFGKKLDIVSVFKGLEVSGREMLEFITLGDDPFDWYNNVKHFL
jgi:hypothetical protein